MEALSLDTKMSLEGIFMPHTRRQQVEAYERQSKSKDTAMNGSIRFVHYTTAQAALSIIRSKRMWMRNATCMSDYLEVRHGYEILSKFFDTPKTKVFADTLDRCAPGAAMEAINLFNQWWDNIQLNTYIASISEHNDNEDLHGRLSMWRAFGGNTTRVAVVIKVPWLLSPTPVLNVLFSPVAYLTEKEAHAMFHEVIGNIETNCDFLRSFDHQVIVKVIFTMLLSGVTCLKHEGFQEEREWRAIYLPKLWPSQYMEASTEVIEGVPQIIYKYPVDRTVHPALDDLDFSNIFDRLIIGPSPYSLAMFEAFSEELAKAGVVEAGARVFVFGIPIRT